MAARIVVIDVISIESMFLRPTRSSWGTREFDTFDYAEILLEVDKSSTRMADFSQKTNIRNLAVSSQAEGKHT